MYFTLLYCYNKTFGLNPCIFSCLCVFSCCSFSEMKRSCLILFALHTKIARVGKVRFGSILFFPFVKSKILSGQVHIYIYVFQVLKYDKIKRNKHKVKLRFILHSCCSVLATIRSTSTSSYGRMNTNGWLNFSILSR